MKKYIVLIVFLFSAISSNAIIPPNPDMCLDCDNVQQMMVGEIRSCSQNYYCCVEQIIANKDENGLLFTDYQPAQYEACYDYPDNHFDCDYASDCIIECR